jgi:tetratricopeptide (TPR) repeat protein
MEKTRHLPLIIALALPCVLCCGCGCDVDWRERADLACARAIDAEQEGKFDRAEQFFLEALEIDPFHDGASLGLAKIYSRNLFAQSEALPRAIYFYSRFINLFPPDSRKAEVVFARTEIAFLKKIESGEMEDPVCAARDIFWAVDKDCLLMFSERLHPDLIAGLAEKDMTPEKLFAQLRKEWNGSSQQYLSRMIVKSINDLRASVTVKVGNDRKYFAFVLSSTGAWNLIKVGDVEG